MPQPTFRFRRNVAGGGGFECPGSVVRISVDPSNPVAFGMPRDAMAFSTGGFEFENTLLPEFNKGDRRARVFVRYPDGNIFASGWASGEKPFGTFKLVLNAVYLASATPFGAAAEC